MAGPAHAHISFENAQAAVGTTYKAVLRIPHGCDGKATDEVRVRIPEGVIAVKPMPKAGWTIEKTVTGYKAEYDLHGKKVAEGVTELSWSGGSVADDEYDDEFVFRATLDASLPAGETIYFPVIRSAARTGQNGPRLRPRARQLMTWSDRRPVWNCFTANTRGTETPERGKSGAGGHAGR
ncbi:DUF1775 domain-containing protein [Mesorhizobium sp.]|uniref:YcnI family copper-binding membrane protein n=1 Tax=Mesorhizobium sp. TaxID=1871066 RepID=UPI0026980271